MTRFDPTKLRALRRRAGMSRERLAVDAGTTYQSVVIWERGRRTPSTPMLLRLAATLGATVEQLCSEDEPAAVAS
jgi:DNA-binding XRE family transcriptional regulator